MTFGDRRSTRLPGHDYTSSGGYLITVCTHDRVCLFGVVSDGIVRLNAAGEIARACWMAIPDHFSNVTLDASVVMPNHVHGIVIIKQVGATHASPFRVSRTTARHVPTGAAHASRARHASPLPAGVEPGSIGAIVGSYKSAVTKQINEMRRTPGGRVWQRNFHDRVIQDAGVLAEIRQYIQDNPANWSHDPYR